MIILFINCKLFPFVDLIIKGLKTYETRNRNTLKALLGKRVFIAETGKGKKPVVRCCCTIAGMVTVTDRKTYNRYRKFAQIEKKSTYDWNSKTVKNAYTGLTM